MDVKFLNRKCASQKYRNPNGKNLIIQYMYFTYSIKSNIIIHDTERQPEKKRIETITPIPFTV